jgi:hypothetical protein
LNWFEAQNAARGIRRNGVRGDLATISSNFENDCIARMLSHSRHVTVQGSSYAWIGGTNRSNAYVWKWDSGIEAGTVFYSKTGIRQYTDWEKKTPVNNSNRCAAVYSNPLSNDGSWNAINCMDFYFVDSYVVEFTSGSGQLAPTAMPVVSGDGGVANWDFRSPFDHSLTQYYSKDKKRSWHCGVLYSLANSARDFIGGDWCPSVSGGVASFSYSPLYSEDSFGSTANWLKMRVYLPPGDSVVFAFRTVEGNSFDRAIYNYNGHICSELYNEHTGVEKICTRKKYGSGWHDVTRGFEHNKIQQYITVDG